MSSPRSNGKVARVVVCGIKGFLEGEERILEIGDVLVIGRSRRVGLSTRVSARLRERDDRAEVVRSNPFCSVSRQHVRIHFRDEDLVEITDLSANGTFLDGDRIDTVAVTDLHERRRILSLGSQERLFLEMIRGDENS